MNNTWIAHRLNVEVGVPFTIPSFSKNTTFYLLPDGTYETKPPMVRGSSNALLRAIESPELVCPILQWTTREQVVAQTLRIAIGENIYLRRHEAGSLHWSFVTNDFWGTLPSALFPSLPDGYTTTLDDIAGGNE